MERVIRVAYIEFDNVSKCYGTGAAMIRALDGASFSPNKSGLVRSSNLANKKGQVIGCFRFPALRFLGSIFEKGPNEARIVPMS